MEKTKRYFTQRELEKHINARLIRERKKNQNLEALKTMVDTLLDEGIINANSYAEAAEELMTVIAENAVGNKEEKEEKKDIADMVKSLGDTDSSCKSSDSTEDEVSTKGNHKSDKSPDKNNNANSHAETAKELMALTVGDTVGNWEAENAVTEKGNDLMEFVKDEDVKIFCGNKDNAESEQIRVTAEDDIADKNGKFPEGEAVRKTEWQTAESISPFGAEEKDAVAAESVSEGKAYDNERLVGLLREFIGILEGGRTSEKKTDSGFFARRNICSTGFSKTGSGEDMRLAQTLTPTQREIARRAGLSYREYAELLREIPENARKRKQTR